MPTQYNDFNQWLDTLSNKELLAILVEWFEDFIAQDQDITLSTFAKATDKEDLYQRNLFTEALKTFKCSRWSIAKIKEDILQ